MSAKSVSYYKSIKLEALTEDEYLTIRDAGMLYVIYPEATGIYQEDVMSKQETSRSEAIGSQSRIDTIGQNGNDGSHYDDAVPYRVSGDDNPDGVIFEDVREWPHVHSDDYSDKVKKVIEDTYELPIDDMFVDDYTPSDPVSPNHYEIMSQVEVIDIIEAGLTKDQFQGYCRGNIIKYQLRANKKNGIEDLRKADVYSSWLVASLEGLE